MNTTLFARCYYILCMQLESLALWVGTCQESYVLSNNIFFGAEFFSQFETVVEQKIKRRIKILNHEYNVAYKIIFYYLIFRIQNKCQLAGTVIPCETHCGGFTLIGSWTPPCHSLTLPSQKNRGRICDKKRLMVWGMYREITYQLPSWAKHTKHREINTIYCLTIAD